MTDKLNVFQSKPGKRLLHRLRHCSTVNWLLLTNTKTSGTTAIKTTHKARNPRQVTRVFKHCKQKADAVDKLFLA
jgi:hypothetical protein